WGAARLTGQCPGLRLMAAAALGAIAALAGFGGWPGLLLLPFCMVWIAWPGLSPPRIVRVGAAVLLSGALLSGLCTLLWQHGVHPLWALAAGSGLMALSGLTFKAPAPSRCSRVEIQFRGSTLRLSAMVDTGNLLSDPVTGLPVIVCSRQALLPLLPFTALTMEEETPAGFRLLSIRTCAGRGLMLLFRPEEMRLERKGVWQPCQALIGVAPAPYDGMQALVPAALIQ
ncbi:MAG: sigma-E processing peptidase SpoIIGA, partial [Clostridia bacterium]|nr:sigma-E processing peptidase SpoIIGA [Clostridia bacterium]